MLAYIALGAVAAVAWVPVLVFFFKNFKTRNNPVSLAIGTLVALVMVIAGPVNYWVITDTADKGWVMVLANVLSIAVCTHFYFAIRWSKRKFQDSRHPGK